MIKEITLEKSTLKKTHNMTIDISYDNHDI